jgi:hypothetical protein
MVFPVIIGLWKFKKLSKPLQLVLFYFIALLFFELIELLFVWVANNHFYLIASFIKKYQISDTSFLGITHILPDFVFVGWAYSFVLNKNISRSVKLISWLMGAVVLFVYFYIDGFNKFGTINPIIDRLYLMIIPLLYFWQLSKEPTNISYWKNPFFLIAIGLFLPNLFSFYMSFFGDKLNETDFPLFVKLSVVRNVFTIIGQIFFALAFYRAGYAKYLINK